MTAFALGHIAAIAIAVSIAAARIVAWILDWRAHTANARIREQAFVAQASADLASSDWTADDELAYQQLRSDKRFMRKILAGVTNA